MISEKQYYIITVLIIAAILTMAYFAPSDRPNKPVKIEALEELFLSLENPTSLDN